MVELRINGSTPRTLWSLSGEQKNRWNFGSVDLSAASLFDSSRGSNNYNADSSSATSSPPPPSVPARPLPRAQVQRSRSARVSSTAILSTSASASDNHNSDGLSVVHGRFIRGNSSDTNFIVEKYVRNYPSDSQEEGLWTEGEEVFCDGGEHCSCPPEMPCKVSGIPVYRGGRGSSQDGANNNRREDAAAGAPPPPVGTNTGGGGGIGRGRGNGRRGGIQQKSSQPPTRRAIGNLSRRGSFGSSSSGIGRGGPEIQDIFQLFIPWTLHHWLSGLKS